MGDPRQGATQQRVIAGADHDQADADQLVEENLARWDRHAQHPETGKNRDEERDRQVV
jgi:hypothetical protein